MYGTQFEIISDHEALTAILKGNRSNKTYSSRLTRRVDRLLPFQFTVTHSPGRTIGMADYLSRHPTPCNKNNQIKAEELWNDLFTANIIEKKNLVLDEQNRQQKENQPIGDEMATESEMTKEKERSVENANQPIIKQRTSAKQATKESKRTDSAEKEVLCKQEKQTIKSIIASINTPNSMSSQSDSDTYEQSTIGFADRPPLKTPICNSINQIEILQNLGNYTFAAQLDADIFLQKVIALVKSPEAAKLVVYPPRGEKSSAASVSIQTNFYTWTKDSSCQNYYAQLYYEVTPRPRQHTGDSSKRMVATTQQGSGRNSPNLPSMQNRG